MATQEQNEELFIADLFNSNILKEGREGLLDVVAQFFTRRIQSDSEHESDFTGLYFIVILISCII